MLYRYYLLILSIVSISLSVLAYNDMQERDWDMLCASDHLKNLTPDSPFVEVAQMCQDRHKENQFDLQSQNSRKSRYSSTLRKLFHTQHSPDDGSYIDDYDGETITLHYDYIVVGAGSAGCEFTATMLEDPSTDGKTFALVSTGPDVFGQNDTAPSLYAWGPGLPLHNLHSIDKFTRDVFQYQYPEANVLSGATQINGGAFVKPPCEYWDDYDYDSWKCEAMRSIINGVEHYKGADDTNTVDHGYSGHTVITTFPAEAETNRWAQAFHTIVPDSPIVTNQDNFQIGLGDIGRAIDVVDGKPVRQAIFRTALYNKTIPGHPQYEPDLDILTYHRCVKLIYNDNGKVKGVHCVDTRRGRVVRLILNDRHQHDTGLNNKVVLAMDAVRIPPFLERSGLGNCTIIQAHGIECRYNNPHIGENLMSDYNVPSMTFGCLNASACPVAHNNGHIAMGYIRSPLQKARNAVTGLNQLDCQVGWRYVAPNIFAVSEYQNVYTSLGSVHMSTADILTDGELVYNNLFNSPDDSKPMVYMLNISRQAAALLAGMGMPVVEMSPGIAATGTTEAQMTAYVVRNGVPQYHNHGTTGIGLVVDEFQRMYFDRAVMIIGGSVTPVKNWIWTHSSNYFAYISGRKGAVDLLTRDGL